MSYDPTVPQSPDAQTLDRRAALGALGKFGLGVAAFGLAGTPALAAPTKNIDVDVLNFALNSSTWRRPSTSPP